MTENEIREFVQSLRNRLKTFIKSGWAIDGLINDYTKSADTIEKLFEEIQQYRAIGTVEELRTAMKYVSLAKKHGTVGRAIDACAEYEAIGTIEDFKALKEKSEPKKAKGIRKYDEAYCPACNEVISDGEFWALDEYVHHCNYCGQAVKGVDWQ